MSEIDGGQRRLTAVVRGRVQAVGFRDFVRREAQRAGLAGYVRNRDDGRSVEVVAEGDAVELEALARTLHRGPGLARVDGVDVSYGGATGDFEGFAIRF